MSDHDHAPTPEDDGDGKPVEFTPDEHRQLCEAVAASVSATLGGLPIRVDFRPECAAFLVEVTGQVPEEAKN